MGYLFPDFGLPIGLSVVDLGPMYATDRQTDVRQKHRLMSLPMGAEAYNKLCWRPPQYAPALCKLTFDLLTLKVVSESRVTWATSVPILVFLGLSVLDLSPMIATDRQRDVRQTEARAHRLMPPALGTGHNNCDYIYK